MKTLSTREPRSEAMPLFSPAFVPDLEAPHRKVLVLEDDLCLKTVVVRVLQVIDPNIEVFWTTTGMEAIQEIGAHLKIEGPPFDLVIADIAMPGEKSGFDLWQTCMLRFPKIPFLFISAMPIDAFLRQLGRNTLCPPFLPKPFKLGECRQVIEGLLSYSAKKEEEQ